MKSYVVFKMLVISLLLGIFMALLAIREQLVMANDELSCLNSQFIKDDEYVDGFEEMKKELK